MTEEIGTSNLLRTWANDGTVVVPADAKIDEGWLRGEQPPHEWMNYIHNVLGQKINHALSRGAADWNSDTEYLAGAIVNRSGDIWLALATNTNSEPSSGNSNWSVLLGGRDNLSGIASDGAARSNLGLGNAATRTVASDAYDFESGRVALTNFAGLANLFSGSISDLNDMPSGFYLTPISGLSNQPADNGNRYWVYTSRAAGLFFQIARRRSGGGANGSLYHRISTGDPAEADWREVWDTDGVVTGENSNGEFIRFPNGWQICHSPTLYDSGDSGEIAFGDAIQVTWTFPAEFAENSALVTPIAAAAAGTSAVQTDAAASFAFAAQRWRTSSTLISTRNINSAATADRPIRLLAIAQGRWL